MQDSDDIVETLSSLWETNDYREIAKSVLGTQGFWGEDLTKVENLTEAIALALKEIDPHGIEAEYANYSTMF